MIKEILVTCIGIAITIGCVVGLDYSVNAALDKHTAREATHDKELAAFRTAWMTDCAQHLPLFQCVALWGEVKPEEFMK